MKEYATTKGFFKNMGAGPLYPRTPAPEPPPLEGGNEWKLVAMTAADGFLFWAWERDK